MREFDYVVVNRHDQLEKAVDDVVAIMRAEHCRSVPQQGGSVGALQDAGSPQFREGR